MQRWCLCRIMLVLMALQASIALGYNLTPIYEESENRLDETQNPRLPGFLRGTAAGLLAHFSDPAHEAVTAKIFGCRDSFSVCGDTVDDAGIVPFGVLDGLRWNDNPIFRLSTRSVFCRGDGKPHQMDLDSDPLCWVTLFYDAERRASRRPGEHLAGPGYALVYRIHFGDLQFIHAMASWDGESAAVTQAHILAWLEFTYKLRNGELASLDAPIAHLVPGLADVFAANGFSARSLFTPQIPAARSGADALLRDMALGSLLHTLEDSYSTAHAAREPGAADCAAAPDFPRPGRLQGFYAYNHQDSRLHKQSDLSPSAETQLAAAGNVAAVGQAVLGMLNAHVPWEQAKASLACVFALADPAAPAGPGPFAPAPSPPDPLP